MLIEKIKNIDSNKTAIIVDEVSISYGELLSKIEKRACFFVNQNKDFLLSNSNDLENLIDFLAIIYLGKKAVFGGKKLTSIQKIALANQFDLEIVDDESNKKLLENTSIFKTKEFKSKELFLGVLTSGTTGESKIIWKDYQSWFSAFPHQSKIFGISDNDRIFVLNSLGYSANLNAVLHGLWLGATLVLGSLSEAKKWQEQFEKLAVTSVFLVPSHYRLLSNTTNHSNRINSLVSAGEKLDVKTAEKLLEIFPKSTLTEYFGAAELGHISYQQNEDIVNFPTSVGKAFPGVKIELKEGEIWVDSLYVSPSFRNCATVNDIGFFDENQNLILLGRQGRMFNRRGLNIFAEEIENASKSHPLVSESVAIEKKTTGIRTNILLFVKPIQNNKFSKKELHHFLLDVLPKNKLPNRIIFVEDIPKTSEGKIDFQALNKVPSEEDIFN